MSAPGSDSSDPRLRSDLDDLDDDVSTLKVEVAKLTTAIEAHEKLDAERHSAVMGALGELKSSVDRDRAAREEAAAKADAARATAATVAEEQRTKRLQILGAIAAALIPAIMAALGYASGAVMPPSSAAIPSQPAAEVAAPPAGGPTP